MSYQKFTNEPCQLLIYWTKVHEIFTRHWGITDAVNAHIEVAVFHSVSDCQSDKWQEIAIFHEIGCHGNSPWDIGKIDPDRSSAPKAVPSGERIAKIGPLDPELIVLWVIIKERRKEINASKTYSPYLLTLQPFWHVTSKGVKQPIVVRPSVCYW